MDSISIQLYELIQRHNCDSIKSSHWRKFTKNFALKNGVVSGISGFSERSLKFPFSNLIHKKLQQKNFRNLQIPFSSNWYKLAQLISLQQHRSLDLDLLRHVFTFQFIEEKLGFSAIDIICVIGDGQANLASLALESNLFKKVISVNLPEVLLSDWELLNCLDSAQDPSLITTSDQMNLFMSSDKRFGMVQASDCYLLRSQPIDLFFNIVSFGEMNNHVIDEYFSIIKSSSKSTTLYCCNRSEKVLPGGEVTQFSNYPWHGYSKIYVDGMCPWHKCFYKLLRNRFIPLPITGLPYDGPILHRLVSYPPSSI